MNRASIFKTGIVLLITVALYIAVQVGAAFIIPRILTEGMGYYIFISVFELLLFGAPALIFLLFQKPRVRVFGGPVSVEQIVLAVIIGVCAYYVSSFVQTLWQLLLRLTGYQPLVPELPLMEGAAGFAVMAVSVAVIPAFVEELMFRGLLFQSLRTEKKLTGAILISSALFMLMHGTVENLPYTFLAGALLAYLAYRSSSLWPGIVMHLTFNLTSVVLFYITNTSGFFSQQTLPDLSDTGVYAASLLVAIPFATIAAGLCFLMLFLFRKVSRPAVQVARQPDRAPWALKWLPILISVFLLVMFMFFMFFATLISGML